MQVVSTSFGQNLYANLLTRNRKLDPISQLRWIKLTRILATSAWTFISASDDSGTFLNLNCSKKNLIKVKLPLKNIKKLSFQSVRALYFINSFHSPKFCLTSLDGATPQFLQYFADSWGLSSERGHSGQLMKLRIEMYVRFVVHRKILSSWHLKFCYQSIHKLNS